MDIKISNEELEHYYGNEAKELHRLVRYVVEKNRFNGLSETEMDDLYGIATDVFLSTACNWDPKIAKFQTYLVQCLSNKIKSYITAKNRLKRGGGTTLTVSLDETVDEDGDVSRGDLVPSTFNVEDTAIRNYTQEQEKSNAQLYMESLTKTERDIVMMMLGKSSKEEIRLRLHLTDSELAHYMESIRMSDRKRILTKNMIVTKEETLPMMNTTTTTSETSKVTQYSAEAIGKAIKANRINVNHPQQRQSDQWNAQTKSDLIVTMLHGYTFPSIILAEQTKDGSTVQWLIDGKQRATTITSYRDNEFKISKNAKRPIIHYKKPVLDENGNQVVRNGFPLVEDAEFDVRKKSYEQLPEELKELIDNYSVGVDLYLNCDDEEVEYHILRFNQARPMTVSQKGIAHLGREFAQIVKGMANLPFFKEECGSYTRAEYSNGTIDRIIIESVMAMYFLSDWKKGPAAAEYLKVNATAREFDGLEEVMNRISDIGTEGVKDMFTSRDTFLWFATFKKFEDLGIDDDEKFVDFMIEFRENLISKEIDGTSFLDLCSKASKDKSVVAAKLSILETLMYDFFHIKKEEVVEEFDVSADAEDYIDKFAHSEFVANVLPSITDNNLVRIAMQSLMICAGQTDLSDKNIQDNLTDYSLALKGVETDVLEHLEDMSLHSLEVKLPNDFYSEYNIPAIVGTYDYANKNMMYGIEFDSWVKGYAENFETNRPFTRDIIGNRNKMNDSLAEYISYMDELSHSPSYRSA